MKSLIFIVSTLITLSLYGQTDEENSHKYWNYRDRLRKNFLRIGNESGQSIPMSARSIGFAYNGAPLNANGNKPSRIYYADATIYLGHYLGVLATEFRLLLNSYNSSNDFHEQQDLLFQLTATKNELYYAIQAVNRLDKKAETYLSQLSSPPSSNDLNGLLLRDDVPEDFHDNFYLDFSEIFQRDCNFIRTHSNAKQLEVWGLNAGTQLSYFDGNIMSLDQITTLFTGLRLVYDLVEDEVIMPNGETIGINLKQEAKSIVHRILDFIVRAEDSPGNDPAFSFTIRDMQGRMKRAGSDMFADAPFLFGIGRHFNYPLFNDWVSEGLQNIRVAIMVDSPKMLEKVQEAPFFVCKNELINRLEEKGNEPINVATISLSQLLILVDELQEQGADFITGNPDLCIEFSNEITEAWLNLDINVEGMLCDNVGGVLNGYMAATVPIIIASRTPIVGELLVNSIIITAELTSVLILAGWFYITMEEPEICLSQLSDDTSPQALQEDNVHILQELGTISGRWTPEYINSMDHPSGLDYYTMIRAVLEPSGSAKSLLNSSYLKSHFLDTAPCEGPWTEPYHIDDPAYCAPNGWASQNRLFHASNKDLGPNDESFRGEFSGLDYMLYYNLYHLLWSETLPLYQRTLSCNCINEFTFEPNITSSTTISRKFEDYKAKGIPIESYLARDLTVNTTSGILNVKNDLIICNELPDVHTTLLCTNSASINLFADNTITVRSGNKIHLTEGSVLNAGLNEVTGQSHYATIILEENAELIVDDGASIICHGGLKLIMKTDSKFTLNDATCVSASGSDESIFFEAQSAEISLLHAQLVCQSNIADRNSIFAQSVFVADASEVVFQFI